MGIKYGLYETPSPKGRKKTHPHARFISYTSVKTDTICESINEFSTLTSTDIKAVLDSLSYSIVSYLDRGHTVHLEGIGVFYPTLKTTSYTNDKGVEKLKVEIDTIGFRCSPKMKNKIRESQLIKEERKVVVIPGAEKRKVELVDFLKKAGAAGVTDIMIGLNLSRKYAKEDIARLLEEGKIRMVGTGNRAVYVVPHDPD